MNLPEQIEQLRTTFMNDLSEIIHSGNYVSGAWVAKFESEFSAFTKIQHSVMVNSGTSALHAVLESLDVKKGDEIIVPAHTFIATASAVLLAGAVPVIVDIEDERPHIDVSAIQAAITPKTVGIIPVHLYGGMADMVQIYALAKSNGLFVLEDSAQAHGANRQGLIPGQHSIASTYSFYPGKNLGGIGEGGAISTIDSDIALSVKAFRSWGEVERYEHSKFGLNYRMDEIQACALSHKLELLANANTRRREIAKAYIDNLEIDSVNSSLLGESVHHIFAIKHPQRDAIRALLNQKGIQTGIHYPKPIHVNEFMPSRSKTPFETTNAINLCSQILSIPIHSSLTKHDVEYVIESVNNSVKQIQI